MRWEFYALLSAAFAGLTAVLAKIGVSQVPSTLATLIRTLVVVVIAAAIVACRAEFPAASKLTGRDWLALGLSGVATGLSWLFYFAALRAGPLSGVAPIDKLSFVIAMALGVVVFRESVRPLGLFGAVLIVIGVLLTIPSLQDAIAGPVRR